MDVQRGAVRGDLHDALVIDVIPEADGVGALRDAGGPVGGGPAHGAAEAAGLVAVGIVGEGGAQRRA